MTSVPADQMALGIAPKDHVGTVETHTHMCVYTSQNVFSIVTVHRKCPIYSKSTLFSAWPKEMSDSAD